jgi:hypothetical protein
MKPYFLIRAGTSGLRGNFVYSTISRDSRLAATYSPTVRRIDYRCDE